MGWDRGWDGTEDGQWYFPGESDTVGKPQDNMTMNRNKVIEKQVYLRLQEHPPHRPPVSALFLLQSCLGECRSAQEEVLTGRRGTKQTTRHVTTGLFSIVTKQWAYASHLLCNSQVM